MRVFVCFTFAFLGCMNASASLISDLLNVHGPHVNPDIFCIMEHCSKESAACVEDFNCRTNMVCESDCGFSNFHCMFKCINTYENSLFDDFMKCAVSDNHCVKLQAPDPTFRCKPPQATMKNFSLSALEGKWYLAYGLNRDFDCFDCQISSYAPTPNSKNLTLTEKYDVVMLNGSIRHRQTVQQVEQQDIFNGGILDFTNYMMSLTMHEKWHIIDFAPSGNYALLYYCGQMTTDWYYEGSLVYSRTPKISADDLTTIETAMGTKLGRKIDEYCDLRTEGCDA